MEMESPNPEANVPCGLLALPKKFIAKVNKITREAKKLGQDDPRRIFHSLKVGLAITMVSLIFYFNPLYEGFGVSAMWAVLTVVVVFEFSVGTTIGRGMNRMVATLLGATSGAGAHTIVSHSGKYGEPILIATFVFIIAAIVTFARFFPKLMAKYDYGLMIFILTFCLVTVSGYRDDEVLHMALRRFIAITIGSVTSVLVCILICPIWIGEDLHNLVAVNLEKLGNFLEGFGDEFFKVNEDGRSSDDQLSLQGFKSVLTSKNSEETMANLASWEPRHGGFRFQHPWKQYLTVASLTRQCAYKIEALSSYLNSDIQIPEEFRSQIQESCTKISSETSKALNQLALSIKTMAQSNSADPYIINSKEAAKTLEYILKTNHNWEAITVLDIIQAATVASLLLQVVVCTEQITNSVNELARLARFQMKDSAMTLEQQFSLRRRMVPTVSENDVPNHAITVGE